MKVLIIHCSYRYSGGEDTVVGEEKALLEAAGVKVEVLLFNNDENTLMNVVQLPFNYRSYRQTLKSIKSFRPDVVHIHNLHFAASPSVLYAIRRTGTPVVCTLHNYRLLCPSALLFHKGKAFLSSIHSSFPWKAVKEGVYKNSRLLTFWMALSMQLHHWAKTWRHCNRFIVLTHYAKEIFLHSKLGLRDEQIVVKPNFASLLFVPEVERGEYFLYAGRLSEEKGIHLLLKVFSSLPYKLKLAGNGPLKEDVVQACAVHKNIEYLGVLKKDDLLLQLATASALVFPSIWFEGMPLTIIEAFACSTPVLASQLGAMDDMVTPGFNGLHFEAGNEQSMTAAMEEWHALPAAEKLIYGQNARKAYEELYTPQKNAEQLLSIYASVMEGRPLALTAAG
jgi:glycosyltransferase involved in cell wall biosynthesis